MGVHLKSLDRQVIVITGATSGIGLATARAAARRGAKVVLAARNAAALRAVVSEIEAAGGEAVGVEADVAREEDVHRIGDAAIDAFGRIDAWVNNAGLSIYGSFDKVPVDDQRKLFETNYWGVVNGAREALRRIKGPGAIISLGSVLSDVPMPLQSAYTASKHAVKGFVDTLRIEVSRQGRPISVTLVKPASIDTPFFDHARNLDKATPAPAPPVYSPHLVAETILRACETPIRETYVGGAAAAMATLRRTAPGAFDWYAKTFLYDQQRQSRRNGQDSGARDNLYAPRTDGQERSFNPRMTVKGRSMYGDIAANPARTWATAAAALAGVGIAYAAAQAIGSPLKSARQGLKDRNASATSAQL